LLLLPNLRSEWSHVFFSHQKSFSKNIACSGGGRACNFTSCSISIGHATALSSAKGSEGASLSPKGSHTSSSNGVASGGEENCADKTCSGK